MTDEQMDARLRGAGERWRATNQAVAQVERPSAAEPAGDVAPQSTPRRRHWGLYASAAVVAAALAVGGGFVLRGAHNGPAPSGDTAALEGHVWVLQDGHGSTSSATLYIDRHGNLVADDECQLIGGKVDVDGTTMTVTDQVVRYKSCTDQYGPSYSGKGAAVLDGAASFSLTPDALTISKNGTDLRFVLAPQNTPLPTLDFPTFAGADWLLVGAKDERGTAVNIAGDSTFHLGDDGQISGTDGCNTLQGSATLEGNQITFGQVGGTEKYCPGDAGATEKTILEFMRGTARETVIGGELTLTKGSSELDYRWNPDSAATDPQWLRGRTWTLVDAAGTGLPIGTKLSVCDGLSKTCDCVDLVVAPGTMQAVAPACYGRGLPQLLGDHAVAWSVYDGRLLLYLNDTQGSALVFGTGSAPPPTEPQLLGTPWQLTSITFGDTVYRNAGPPAQPSTLTLTANSFAAKHICYTNKGDLSRNGNRLGLSNGHTVNPLPCPFNPGNATEDQAVDAILGPDVSWSIADGTLTITNPGSGTLVYSDGTSSPKNLPLVGTDWRLETAVVDSGAAYAATGQRFAIDASGRVVANDGVNTTTGPVTVHDGALTFGRLGHGDLNLGSHDGPVLRTIDELIRHDSEVGYDITGDTLRLTNGSTQLIYRAHVSS